MSDSSEGEGWWQASDGKWYPPSAQPHLPPPPQAAAAGGARVGLSPAVVAILAGAGALILGSFLPWVKASAPFLGTITKSGVEGGDGWILIILAIAILGMCWPVFTRRPLNSGAAFTISILGLLALALGVYEWADVSARADDLGDSAPVIATVGAGIYVVVAGALAVIAGGVIEWNLARTKGDTY